VAYNFPLSRRILATARNAAEYIRFGGLETDEQSSPYVVTAEHLTYRLRHYFPQQTPQGATPVLLVPPLMMSTEVWDVTPDTSGVAAVHRAGADPWVVDFGDPGHEPGGWNRTLTDHVLAVSDAVDRVAAATGKPVVLIGYSQGGMFVYQAAAYRRNKDLDSIVTMGSPVDTTAPLPIPISPEVTVRLANTVLSSGVLEHVNLPKWAVRIGFKALSPAKTVQGRIDFLRQLHDREALLPRERQRRFLDREGWTAYSGPAIAELFQQFVQHNRMLEGGFVIDDRLVTLADIEVPILTFVGNSDTIGHPDSVRAIRRAAPRAEVYETTLHSGHFGLVVGSTATSQTWPAVAAWLDWRSDCADLPADILRADLVEARPARPAGQGAAALARTVDLGVGASRMVVKSARRAVRSVRAAGDATWQLGRLARLQSIAPTTRISLGLLLDEQVHRDPEDLCFAFGDRAHRRSEVKHRIDNVVKGLISVGIRHGDRVGVLMSTRPSAFTVLAALSRLGATAVVLRPDGDLLIESGLGEITWVVSDPEHAGHAGVLPEVTWCVLGGGTGAREFGPPVVDMERIDPAGVVLPAWYTPNPGRAGDTAFVLFSGEGSGTRAMKISNRRWALSALGTATAAALKPGDTVYSVTPIHHSSALLMSVSGAVAGGARFAMATAPDVDRFWEEVRRYGATHVSYTWTSLRDVVLAPPNPNEPYNPIKMFLGSGMPRNLWQRVNQRFPSVQVVEFYASVDGEAILANLTGTKLGSMGRPIPGTAEVRVARYNQWLHSLVLDEQGLAVETRVDEVGLLLARRDPAEVAGNGPDVLRSVFEPGDAWTSTEDLFVRDEDGDLWLAGGLAEVVRTGEAITLPSAGRFCLGQIPAVDLVVAYGVPDPSDSTLQVFVAAATLRPDTSVTAAELDVAFDRLPASYRPRYVQIVPSIPLTTWHRPIWSTLQARGIPKPGRGRTVFESDGEHYHQL